MNSSSPGFSLCYTPEGQPYYYCAKTGSSLWASPHDWELQYDPLGRAVYYNRVTGESQWADASAALPVPAMVQHHARTRSAYVDHAVSFGVPVEPRHNRSVSLGPSSQSYQDAGISGTGRHRRGGSEFIDSVHESSYHDWRCDEASINDGNKQTKSHSSKFERRRRAEKNIQQSRRTSIRGFDSSHVLSPSQERESLAGSDAEARITSTAPSRPPSTKREALQHFMHHGHGASSTDSSEASTSDADSDSSGTHSDAGSSDGRHRGLLAGAASMLFDQVAALVRGAKVISTGGTTTKRRRRDIQLAGASGAGGTPLTISRALAPPVIEPVGEIGGYTLGTAAAGLRDVESDIADFARQAGAVVDADSLKVAADFVYMSLPQRTAWLREHLGRFGAGVMSQAGAVAVFLSTASLPLLAHFLSAVARGTADTLSVVHGVVRKAAERLSPRSELPLPLQHMHAQASKRRSAFPLEYLPEAPDASQLPAGSTARAGPDEHDGDQHETDGWNGPPVVVQAAQAVHTAITQCRRGKRRKGAADRRNGIPKEGSGSDGDDSAYLSAVSPASAHPWQLLRFLPALQPGGVILVPSADGAVPIPTTADHGAGAATSTEAPPTLLPWARAPSRKRALHFEAVSPSNPACDPADVPVPAHAAVPSAESHEYGLADALFHPHVVSSLLRAPPGTLAEEESRALGDQSPFLTPLQEGGACLAVQAYMHTANADGTGAAGGSASLPPHARMSSLVSVLLTPPTTAHCVPAPSGSRDSLRAPLASAELASDFFGRHHASSTAPLACSGLTGLLLAEDSTSGAKHAEDEVTWDCDTSGSTGHGAFTVGWEQPVSTHDGAPRDATGRTDGADACGSPTTCASVRMPSRDSPGPECSHTLSPASSAGFRGLSAFLDEDDCEGGKSGGEGGPGGEDEGQADTEQLAMNECEDEGDDEELEEGGEQEASCCTPFPSLLPDSVQNVHERDELEEDEGRAREEPALLVVGTQEGWLDVARGPGTSSSSYQLEPRDRSSTNMTGALSVLSLAMSTGSGGASESHHSAMRVAAGAVGLLLQDSLSPETSPAGGSICSPPGSGSGSSGSGVSICID